MDEKKREIRTIPCKLAIREAAPDAEGESRTITGTAIVFNAESEVLDDWGYRFREVILPEAASMEFLNSQDIKMNMLHDRNLTIARCNKGEGSMRLSVDEKGVQFEFEAPRCDIGDRCLEMVRRGDYSGCSFEFYPGEYDIEERDEVRRLTRRGQHRGDAALEIRDLRGNRVTGRVCETGVEIAAFFQIEELTHFVARIVLERGRLNDGQDAGFPVFR